MWLVYVSLIYRSVVLSDKAGVPYACATITGTKPIITLQVRPLLSHLPFASSRLRVGETFQKAALSLGNYPRKEDKGLRLVENVRSDTQKHGLTLCVSLLVDPCRRTSSRR
jgi:hypothetical protein